TTLARQLCTLADEKNVPFWRVNGSLYQGSLFALTGDALNAVVRVMTSAVTALQSTGFTLGTPWWLSHLAIANCELRQFGDAWRCVGEAMSTIEVTKERWYEAELNRVAGELKLKSTEPDLTEAGAYFERSLNVARQQQAKSWELRAAMSLARLWRDQG